jgi:hypothetical protein
VILRAALWTTLAALAAGCPTNSAEFADSDDDDSLGANECEIAADCVPAAASCCECPSYALPVTSDWDQSCADVDCVDPDYGAACPRTEAACEAGWCALRCEPVECDLPCVGAFDVDSFGCLACSCGDGPPPTDVMCEVDAECVRAAADCCGCENGGADTAVPTAELAAFEAELDCDPSPVCPGVNTCDPELVPRCLGGACALAAPPGPGLTPDAGPDDSPADPAYCGGSYGPCPPDQVCVLNDPDADEASSMGVGVCRTP